MSNPPLPPASEADDLPALPPGLANAIAGKDSGTSSTLLSIYRTRLGMRRTGLADLRSHLANERTHLAYLRTAVSLVGFGITLNRFSVFLQQQGTVQQGQGGPLLRSTENVGLGMVVLGLVLAGWALFRFRRVNQDIKRGQFHSRDGAVLTITVLFLFFGGLTALWLTLM
jgi:putative membrane protein